MFFPSRTGTSLTLVASLALLAGCAGRASAPPESEPPAAACGPCDDGGQQASAVAGADAGAGARSRSLYTAHEEPAPGVGRAGRWEVRRIGASAQGGSSSGDRPRRSKKVDIDLSRAPFDEVMRLLGDTGKFNVVVETTSASDVTIRLRGVEPYDALLVIAEARGIDVDYRRGVVVVGSPGK